MNMSEKSPPLDEVCPRCGTQIREGDVFCSKCSYKLVNEKISEEMVTEIKVFFWLSQAKNSEKWALGSLLIGAVLIVLYFVFQSKVPSPIWILIFGVISICVGSILQILSFYINQKLQKGEIPFGQAVKCS
jgi:hypothetical protein